jgi:sulfate permease, SulP family
MSDRGAPRWARFMPGLHTLVRYDRSWLRGDVVAGLTVAAYLIPQVMAYAEVAGLPPITGLWGILVPLAVYAVLGSSRQLSVGPESTSALMTAVGVSALVGATGGERYADVAALLAVGVGLICVLGWVFRLGFLANLLSRPLLVGYLAGISVLMITSQLGKLTGLRVTGDGPVAQVGSLVAQLQAVHAPTVVLAGAVLVALFVLARWAPKLPGPLVVGVAAAAVVAALGLDRGGIATIGPVPQGLPALRVPDPTSVDAASLLPYAFGIALVGYSENVLTARAFAANRREKLDGGQELLAMGAINLGASLFQGFPVSSSSSRTVLGNAMGSRTQLHSLVAMALVLATLLFLGPLLSTFPTAALGAVVVYAAVRLIDVPEWRRIARFRRSEVVLALATATAVVGFGVLNGILFAVALSILDLIRRIAHPHDGVLGYVPGLAGMHDIDDYPQANLVPGLLVYRYDSPLFFANSADFTDRAIAAVDAADPTPEWFVLNAEANVEVDLTAVDALDQLRESLAARGITFAMARVKQDLRGDLAAAGFVDRVGQDRIFPTLPTAVAGYSAWYTETHGRPPVLPTDLPPSNPSNERGDS